MGGDEDEGMDGQAVEGLGTHAYRQATSSSCFVRNPYGSDSVPGKRKLWHRPRAVAHCCRGRRFERPDNVTRVTSPRYPVYFG